MPFNKVLYTSDFRRYLANLLLHSQKFHLFQIGKKTLPRDAEHFYMHNDIMPRFIRQEAKTWQTVFFGEVGKGGAKKRIKIQRNLLKFPHHLVHRAVRIFVRNAIV